MQKLLSISQQKLRSFKISDWAYTEELKSKTYNEYLKWVEDENHGPLKYLADERKLKRENLNLIYPECISAISFLFNYTDSKKNQSQSNPDFKVASYVTGFEDQDYHFWIKDKLKQIGELLKKDVNGLEYFITLDVHPVLERDLAYRSGLGWFGKNSMLISREFGSYTLIGSLLLNKKIDLTFRDLEPDHCGSCTRCIDACPTKAIYEDARVIDSNKCISTFTIETFRDEKPPQGYPVESHEVFGCDICQEVCPWNNKPLNNAQAAPESSLINFFNRDLDLIILDIEQMSNKGFKIFFKNTSFERVGKRGLLKNLKHYQLKG